MPVYEFKCEDCGRRFELVATLAEQDAGLEPECPKCGSGNCRQVFGRVNIVTSSKSDSDLDDFGEDDGLGDMPDNDYGGDFGDESGLDEPD